MLSSLKSWIFNFFFIFRYAGPEPKRYAYHNEKQYWIRVLDLFKWLYRESDCNRHYYLFGVNQKSCLQSDYIGSRQLLRIKKNFDTVGSGKYVSNGLSYDLITKDKFVFYAYMKACNLPTVPVKYFIFKVCRNTIGEVKSIDSVIEEMGTCIIKNTLLEGGEGFMFCSLKSDGHLFVNHKRMDFVTLRNILSQGSWIVQEVMKSHTALSKVNASALNITRIVTVRNASDIQYLGGFQSFATGNALNDSWNNGSIYVGFNRESGRLQEYGYYHIEVAEKTVTHCHPDSQVIFSEFTIPYVKEAIDLCIQAHSFLPYHFLVGWDVAITENGPILLEANEKPGMNAVQVFEGGLRKSVVECAENTINSIKANK